MAVAFWISIGLLAWAYLLYPLLCAVRARLGPRRIASDSGWRPASVSVLVAAYNEAENIEARLRNIVGNAAPFPLEVLVGSDGSSDATAARAAAMPAPEGISIRVFDWPRSGKYPTLRKLVSEARGEVLVFTDANTAFGAGALERIVAPLADPSVGCAAGAKRVSGGNEDTREGERAYWTLENRLKAWESAVGSCPGADGALYAVRRSAFPDLATERLVMDDFLISLGVIASGKRCVFVPEAVAWEPSDTDLGRELRRKGRILAGALNVLLLRPRLLLPGSGISLALWSHKVLRWFGFVPLAVIAVALFTMLPWPAGAFVTAVSLASAAAGLLLSRWSARLKTFGLPGYFLLINLGQALGLFFWLRDSRRATWEKVR